MSSWEQLAAYLPPYHFVFPFLAVVVVALFVTVALFALKSLVHVLFHLTLVTLAACAVYVVVTNPPPQWKDPYINTLSGME